MKPQFVKINALQNKSNRPEQSPNGGPPADAHPGVPVNRPWGGQPPIGQLPQRPVSGQPSNWNAGSLQPPHPNGTPGPQPVTEREAMRQPSVNGPAGPARSADSLQAQRLAYGQVPPSPNQSAITSFPRMGATPQTPPPQYPGMQPYSPVSRPNPPPQPYMAPMSMAAFSRAPLAPMPPGYPGVGGPPPFGQPPGYPGVGGPPPFGQPPGEKRKKRRFPIWARVAVSLFLLLLVVVGGLGGYYYFNLATPVSHIVGQQVTRLKGDEDPNASRNGADILSGPRVNILLLGSDTDQKFSNGQYLAQSDIVITIDPATKKVGMLSIPRDFYINVPGGGMRKLDEAYGLGGVALSRLTIFQDFGIPINYYAWVGLDGFIKVIDTVGGVDVDALHPITDDNYPDDVGNKTGDINAYKRLYISPGPQHLSGSEALEYVRSRHADLVGDFGRSARQQQILSALKTKLNNPAIIGKLPEISNDLNGYVKTDMQLTDVLKLLNFARGLDPNSIQRLILGPPYSASGVTPTGESVVYPDCTKITPLLAQMFGLGNNARCDIQANSNNNTSSLASASQPSAAPAAIPAASTWQAASQVADISAMSIGGSSDNLFGFHSLLDLMFMVVFESPDAMQV